MVFQFEILPELAHFSLLIRAKIPQKNFTKIYFYLEMSMLPRTNVTLDDKTKQLYDLFRLSGIEIDPGLFKNITELLELGNVFENKLIQKYHVFHFININFKTFTPKRF